MQLEFYEIYHLFIMNVMSFILKFIAISIEYLRDCTFFNRNFSGIFVSEMKATKTSNRQILYQSYMDYGPECAG